jgi:hypothetical protein
MTDGIPPACQPIAERCQRDEEYLRAAQDDLYECESTHDPSELDCDAYRRQVTWATRRLAACREELQRCIEGLPPEPISNLRIAGIEVTQAIQYFNFNGKGSGLEPNNIVPLVANNPTILRVYVDRSDSPRYERAIIRPEALSNSYVHRTTHLRHST